MDFNCSSGIADAIKGKLVSAVLAANNIISGKVYVRSIWTKFFLYDACFTTDFIDLYFIIIIIILLTHKYRYINMFLYFNSDP